MTKKENIEFKVEMKFRAIELLNSSLHSPSVPTVSVTNFNFNISIETKTDEPNKLVFVIVNIDIRNDDQSLILGSVSVSCIYEIVNFETLIKNNAAGKLEIPLPLIEMLNSISISTVRGVMFSTFKGTFLHNAVLPIINPKQLQPTQIKPEE